jgi:hypothetical protein
MGSMDSVTDGSESGDIYFQQINSGTIHETFRTNANGKLKLSQYGSNSFTGTAVYALAVDSSGNVIETAVQGSPTGGSGTAGKLTKWDTSSTLTDSVITESGGNIGIGTATPSSVLHIKDDTSTVYTAANYQKDFIIERKNTSGNNQSAHIRFLVTGYEGQTTGEASIGVVQTSNVSSGHIVFTNRHNGTRSETVRIQSDGKVGIGTTSPSSKLHVKSSGDGSYIVRGMSSAGTDLGGLYQSTSGDGEIYLKTSAVSTNVRISSNNVSYFNGGNVGIGTASPSSLLTVAGTTDLAWTASTSKLQISRSSTVARLQNYESGSVANLAIQWEGGNVGIGTTAPARKLHVQHSSISPSSVYGTVLVEEVNESSIGILGTTYSSVYFGDADSPYTGGIVYAHSDNRLEFRVNGNSERMRITNTGAVGIAVTNPTQRLDVNGKVRARSWFTGADDTNTLWSSTALGTYLQAASFTGTGSEIAFRRTDGSVRMLIDTETGNVGIGTTSPVAKLDVNGATRIGGKTTYTKAYASLNTTGNAVAGLGTSGNGASARLVFEIHGGAGEYQRVVYSCYNASGNWYPTKAIDEGTNAFDVTDSGNGTTVTFTFKARTASQAYSPYVTIEHVGAGIDTQYL